MRKIYAERRDFFIKQFNELLGDYFTLQVPEAGLNVVAWLRREEEFPKYNKMRHSRAEIRSLTRARDSGVKDS
jgi:DNA-binding transcriptional MocR family regulator